LTWAPLAFYSWQALSKVQDAIVHCRGPEKSRPVAVARPHVKRDCGFLQSCGILSSPKMLISTILIWTARYLACKRCEKIDAGNLRWFPERQPKKIPVSAIRFEQIQHGLQL